jgi:anti-sigma B factor antagonist
MPIETRTEAGTAIVTITGRLTLGRDLERLETAVSEAITAGQTRIVLDVAGLDYLDSSGVGTIVGCLSNAKKAGGDLRLAGTSPRVARIFQLTGVNALVTVYPDLAAALGA